MNKLVIIFSILERGVFLAQFYGKNLSAADHYDVIRYSCL